MGYYYNHPTLPVVFFTVLATRRTNTSFTFFSMQLPVMLCLSLVLLLFVHHSEAQPGYLTVEPSQQGATLDGKKHAKAIGPEFFTTSSLPAASPAGMVTSITDLSMQEQDTFDNKLSISTLQSFPEQFQQQGYSQPKTKVSPQYLSKSRTNNVRSQGSLTTFPEEEEKMFPELLPVVTLVEKLQSQVLDLQRMRLEDRSQISQIQAQLSTQQEQILVITSDLMQLKQMTLNHGQQTDQLAKTVKEHNMSQKSLVNMETELKVRLDDFVLSQRNVSQAMSIMKSSSQQLTSKTDGAMRDMHDMKKTLEEITNISQKHSKAIKNLKKTVKDFAIELIPENKEETLNMDIAVDEGLLVDVDTNKLPYRVGNINTDLEEHSGESSTENSASKNIPDEQLDESIYISPVQTKKNETIFQELEKYNQRLTRIYGMYFNLSLDVRNLKAVVSNLTERVATMEGVQLSDGEPGSEQQISEEDAGQMVKMAANHTHRFQDMEHKLVVRQNDAFQKQHTSLQRHMIQLVNTSTNNLQRRMDQIQTKYDNKLNEKMKHTNREMHGVHDKVLSLEARILNVSLSSCQRVNHDLQQDIKLRDAEKNIIRLKAAASSNKDQIKRLEYRIYRMHHWMKNHTGILEVLQTKTDSLDEYVSLMDQVEEDIYNLRLHLPKDCSDTDDGVNLNPGVLVIYPREGFSTVQVFCDADIDGAWTVIQRRFNGSVDFNRSWDEYKYGFGSVDSEYWLGNEFVHLLTSKDNYSLKIEMVDIYGKFWVATYDSFHIGSETDGYTLKVSSYSGNSTDSLNYSNNSPFSTMDVDHDASSTHCAVHYTAGWWYRHCHYGNLNGRYKVGIVWFNQEINDWIQMKSSVMKIKRNTVSTSADQFIGQ